MVEKKRSMKPLSRSDDELEKQVQNLTVKLAIANEALRVEIAKSIQLEEALEASEKRLQSLMVGSAFLIQKMKDEVQQAQKMVEVGQIISPALAHDLGNLITAISSQAQFCMENTHLNSAMEENLQMIYESTKKAKKLVKGFLEFVKSTKSDTLNYKPLKINKVITRMRNTAELNVDSRQISFGMELEDDLPEIMGEVEKLERVFLNLF